jgi:hypothetical protein
MSTAALLSSALIYPPLKVNLFWMSDQIRHDDSWTSYKSVNIGSFALLDRGKTICHERVALFKRFGTQRISSRGVAIQGGDQVYRRERMRRAGSPLLAG